MPKDYEAQTPPGIASWMIPTLALAVIAAFWAGLAGGFVFDDLTLVARDPLLRDLGRLPELLTKPLWSGLPELSGSEAATIGHWRPLTSLTLALGYALAGSPSSPLLFHLISLLLHALGTFAAFRLALRIFPASATRSIASFFAALLFALHPLHVESVSWISAVNDPLFGLFSILALSAWLDWRSRDSKGLPLAAAVLFLCALLSKELAIALLPIAFVLDRTVVGGRTDSSRGWGALGAAVAIWYGLRTAVFSDALAGFGRTNAEFGELGRSLMLRLEILGGGMFHLLLPLELSPFRPFRVVLPEGDHLHFVQMIGAMCFVAGLTFALLKRDRISIAGLLILPAGLLPVLLAAGSLGQTPYADRYLYLPAFGYAILLSHLAFRALPKNAAVALLSTIALAFGVKSTLQADMWSDQETLYQAAVVDNPDYPMVYWQLGEIYRQKFLAENHPGDLEAAFDAFDASNRLLERANKDLSIPRTEIDNFQTALGKAWCYLHQAEGDTFNDYDTPRTILNMLLEKVFEREQANMATGGKRASLPVEQVFGGLGVCDIAIGDLAAAEKNFKQALEFNPNYAPAVHNLGVVYFRQEKWELARKTLERALDLKPKDTRVLLDLARSLFEGGWPDNALVVAARISEIDPSTPEPKILEGSHAFKRRDWRAALAAFDAAIALDSRSSFAHFRRGMTLYQMNEMEFAITALRRACELSATNFEAHYNLGSFLMQNGSASIAQPYLDRAYSIGGNPQALAAMRLVLYDLDTLNGERLQAFAQLDETRGDPAGALWWAERALAVNPDNGNLRFLKGRILLGENEFTLALPELVDAVQLLPSAIDPAIDLGRCYAGLGNAALARFSFERALKLAAERPMPAAIDEQEGFLMMQKQYNDRVNKHLLQL